MINISISGFMLDIINRGKLCFCVMDNKRLIEICVIFHIGGNNNPKNKLGNMIKLKKGISKILATMLKTETKPK